MKTRWQRTGLGLAVGLLFGGWASSGAQPNAVTPAPSGMVLIPAGSFTTGDTFGEREPDERPTHTVQIESAAGRAILIEGETPDRQFGSLGKGPELPAASGGNVLCQEWGAATGHFAEYRFAAKESLAPARIEFRYARALAGDGHLQVALDGRALGTVVYHSTGGWGDKPSHYRTADIIVGPVKSGPHSLRLTVVAGPGASDTNVLAAARPAQSPMLDFIGNRADKNTVGHGNNVALYTGRPSKFFFATHELGNIFSAADGATVNWYPDHVLIEPGPSAQAAPNVNIDKIEISQVEDAIPAAKRSLPKNGKVSELRQVCVTKDDVVVSRITLHNLTGQPLAHTIEVTGDCRGSFDWREGPGGVKHTRRESTIVLLEDHGVFPAALSNGLCMAIGANLEPAGVDTAVAGTYRITYQIQVPGNATKSLTLACAINRDQQRARECLGQVLKQDDPIASNRQDWQAFYEREIPQFSCSDPGLMELYGLRWFLLKFSTAGGDLGFFKYPVVMEGREAYQTYCCYSAPFMAYDMNWCVDPQKGFGHIANMCEIAYEDGRFPFYTSPRTNKVQLHHASRTGQSALEDTMWKHFLIHGDKRMLQQVYPAMKKNMQWWIKDRDADGNGLFVIMDQLECMDDVYRWGHENRTEPYESLTANSTTYINLRGIARIARVLGNSHDADYFDAYADKTRNAVNSLLWDRARKAWFDRRLGSGQLATHYPIISMFYPFYARIGGAAQMDVFREHLLNRQEFWLPFPVPALPRNHPAFGPEKFWQGPAWPASTSHVLEGFSSAAKEYDRSLLPKAAELFRSATSLHMQPRADFYERYNPLTGNGLSRFRDYMHSWWIDLIIRHAVGLIINDDGSIIIDPLPIGLDNFALQGVPFRGQRIDITWREPDKAREDKDYAPGLTVKCNGRTILQDPHFRPGSEPKHIQSPVPISGF